MMDRVHIPSDSEPLRFYIIKDYAKKTFGGGAFIVLHVLDLGTSLK
jgi:hypothetical protein